MVFMVFIMKFKRLKNNCKYGRWIVFVLASLVFNGCDTTKQQVSIPFHEKDNLPEVTISAIPYLPPNTPGSIGDIEKGSVNSEKGIMTSKSISNVDLGTFVQFSASAMNGSPPSTTGGVQSLSFTITRDGGTIFQGNDTGTQDANGKVPNWLSVPKAGASGIEFQITSPVVVAATAKNFNGDTTNLTVTYVPLDPNLRGKDTGGNSSLVLNKVFGQNTYTARLPKDDPPPNGFLKYLNGVSPQLNLMFPGQPTTKCTDPSASISLPSSGNLNPGDLTKLFGSETPSFPLTIVACSNPFAPPLPDHLEIKATYQLK